MKKIHALALFHACTYLAVAQDVNPVDHRQMLQELQEIGNKQAAAEASLRKRNIEQISKAAGSKDAAIAFYEEAQMVTQFQGTNRENTQFREWKKRQEELLKNDDFQESVRLHLYYLGLSLRKAADARPEEIAPQVADYLRVLETAKAALEAPDSYLNVSVAEGIFAKWLRLGPELAKARDWEMKPGNADEIAGKFLLPWWRKQKNPALLAYWDGRIARANAEVGNAKLDFQAKNTGLIIKPELQWQRAEEFIVLDQPNRAVQEMFGLIKNYPTHPKAGEWIAKLEKLLSPSAKPTSPAPGLAEP